LQLIGLSGYARAGKDEAAKALQELGFVRIAFADKLRECLYALNPIVDFYDDGPDSYFERLQNVVDEFGWDGYKDTHFVHEIRPLLQRLGTEVGRNILGSDVWVNATLRDLDVRKNYVITDCRFPNEAGAVQDFGGKILRITRTGVGPANNHPSETSLDDWDFDYHVNNDGTLEDFHRKIKATVGGVVSNTGLGN